ncbi:MAG: C4-dicarboxylate transporter DcuC [Betaproteobacteria bacterium]|nr:C4-dicarboxylate transporter DcuC [Betaproteobacteria bacterium]
MSLYAQFELLMAVVVIVGAVYLLVKQYETRTVLIGAGFVLCIIALKPLLALDAFVKAMTTAGLIQNICAAMGFAYVMKLTRCDTHLVKLLLKPLKNFGFMLIPATFVLTFFINIAIPSAAGCAAAVGATMIPMLMAAGVRPAMAAAAVFAGTFGSIVSPGLSHTALIADMTGKTIPDVITVVAVYGFAAGAIVLVGLPLMALVFGDYRKGGFAVAGGAPVAGAAAGPGATPTVPSVKPEDEVTNINVFYALGPLVPLAILIAAYLLTTFTDLPKTYKDVPAVMALLKIGVAQAMIIGALYGLAVTWSSPAKITKQFFTGMGNAYADVIGIIIAASVFAAGLEAAGAIKWFIDLLTGSPQFARWGATVGPFLMALVTGSGDAATMAFNKSITPHAATFGYAQANLGMAAALAGTLGRSASPLAGAAIVCAGLAGVSPVELAKRTWPAMTVAMLMVAIFML